MRFFLTTALFLVALLLSVEVSAKPSSPPPAKPAPALPMKVDKADALELRAVQAEYAEQIARRDNAKLAHDAAVRAIGPLDDQLLSLWRMFAAKYNLDPTRDHFDVRTLEIVRAPTTPSTEVKK